MLDTNDNFITVNPVYAGLLTVGCFVAATVWTGATIAWAKVFTMSLHK